MAKHHPKTDLTAELLPFPGADEFTKPKAGAWSSSKPRCYETHPDFEVAPGLFIRGGSCISPKHKTQDVYIGFDGGMTHTSHAFPWETGKDEVYFRIPDGNIPHDAAQFRKLVEWTAEQLKAGRQVHAGCIGGHGRTGMFLAALRHVMVPEDPDPITTVRQNYCKKAVETNVQIEFLMKEYGAAKVEPSKPHYTDKKGPSSATHGKSTAVGGYKGPTVIGGGKVSSGPPQNAQSSIWGG